MRKKTSVEYLLPRGNPSTDWSRTSHYEKACDGNYRPGHYDPVDNCAVMTAQETVSVSFVPHVILGIGTFGRAQNIRCNIMLHLIFPLAMQNWRDGQ